MLIQMTSAHNDAIILSQNCDEKSKTKWSVMKQVSVPSKEKALRFKPVICSGK